MVIFPVRIKILLIVLGFFLLIALAFTVYSVATTENYRQLRLESIKKTVEFEAERVNKRVAEIDRAAIFFVIASQVCFEAQSKALGEKLAIELFESFPAAIGGGFWFAPYAYNKNRYREGFYAFYDSSINAVRLDDDFFLDAYDYHNTSWYIEISENLTKPYQVVWTAPYVDDSGSMALMTTAGAGFFDINGNLLAISTIDRCVDETIEKLSAIKPTPGSFVLLCAPEKDYIITNTFTKDCGGAALDSVGASLSTLEWDINDDEIFIEGVRYLAFNKVIDNGWLLSVIIPKDEIFAEIESRNQLFTAIIFIASFILLIIAAYLLSHLINRPLIKLTTGVKELGSGNLHKQIQLHTNDEFGLLAKTFNKMTVDLKKSIEQNAKERAEKERIGAELNVATQIQANMLPCIFPAFPEQPEFDIYASMTPAKEVGGDFYDFFMIDENKLAVVIADVSGKGIPAALFMVIAKTLIKNNAQQGKSPSEVFDTVNALLCENNSAAMFVTAFMGFFEIDSGKFTFVNAGHNPPLHRQGENFQFLKSRPNFVLAGNKKSKYKEYEITLNVDDLLYLYTDGVTEAMNPQKKLFGEDRLYHILDENKDKPLDIIQSNIKSALDIFADGEEQADDITMLVLKIIDIPSKKMDNK